MSLPPFLARLTTYMHCTCMCMHACIDLLFLCSGALKTSAPHAWCIHCDCMFLCMCVCVSVHASNATNLIAAFGWKSFIRSI